MTLDCTRGAGTWTRWIAAWVVALGLLGMTLGSACTSAPAGGGSGSADNGSDDGGGAGNDNGVDGNGNGGGDGGDGDGGGGVDNGNGNGGAANGNSDNDNGDGGDGGTDNGNGDTDGGGDPEEFIFPLDYDETFTEVRNCRNSFEGHPENVRVLVNDIGVEAYLNNVNPLPEGTIVVKEVYQGVGCEEPDGELFAWSAMRKMAPGFDPDDGDWAWQEVNASSGLVLFDGKAACIGCHSAEDCIVRDYMCTEE